MAYECDDALELQAEALRADLRQVEIRLRQLRFGDVHKEIKQLSEKHRKLAEKLDSLRRNLVRAG